MRREEFLQVIYDKVNRYRPDWPDKKKRLVASCVVTEVLRLSGAFDDSGPSSVCSKCGLAGWLIEENDIITCFNCGNEGYSVDDD